MKTIIIILILILVSCGKQVSESKAVHDVDSTMNTWYLKYLDTVIVEDTIIIEAEAFPIDTIPENVIEFKGYWIHQEIIESTKYKQAPHRVIYYVTKIQDTVRLWQSEIYSSDCKLEVVKNKLTNEAKGYIRAK